ncbi:Retinoblastoma-related protein 1 [Senna tora]|uniref:Retinoblastoma-related protein 1 n=1 Tax=Senna tora TaxID=362788 RepID=A0A834TQJ5_9FABA|nr:Retinoblastoma-related protein 1 [Senna tora]
MSPPEVMKMVDGEHGDAIESRFTEFCKNGLSLDEKSFTQAMKLFGETKCLLLTSTSSIGSKPPEEAERYWFSFILYSVKKLAARSADNEEEADYKGFTICQLLRAAKLKIPDFFKELPQFVVKTGPILSTLYGMDWENRLEVKEMQANVVHLGILSKYYKRAFGEFFANDANTESHSSITLHASKYHRFGWLLFLALREHAFSRFRDLVTCTNGLVSILAILIIHIPARFRNFNINDSSRFVTKGSKGVDLLASLCIMYHTSEDELKKTMEKANNLIADILKKKPCLASECEHENLEIFDRDGLIYFKDLMEESCLPSSLNNLENNYDYTFLNKGELDERLFIDEEDSLLASGSSISTTGVKRKFDSLASPSKTITSPLSPCCSPASHAHGILGSPNSKTAATPVSTAMTTAKWLRTFISPLASKPSPDLERFLASCDRDVTSDVVSRAQIILQAIFPSSPLGERCVTRSLQSANLMDNVWAEQRRLEALKLYYRVLEAMCRAEAQILHVTNLTSLLTNERFHRCMLACAAELVLATHKTVTMLFPAVLERTGITAFDLSKVIESFIRHEESLPRELKRHLNSLEERLLENMVWEKGSSLYNSLSVARPALCAEINHLGLLAEPMPSLDAIAIQINFSCGGLPPVPSLQKLETSSSQNGDTRSPKRLCTENRSVVPERNSFTSPVKDRRLPLSNLKARLLQPPLQSAFASPTKPIPGGGGETCAETGISIFFGKIIKLAAVRTSGMVERLQLSQETRENVFCLFQKVLNQHTSLFFNRHIDQIILCCFYAVAKISQLSLTFKEIILNYRKQPQCKPQVSQSVFVDWSLAHHNGRTGQEHVNVVRFYNEIFIPSVKPLLDELRHGGTTIKSNRVPEVNNRNDGHLAQCPGSPKISSFPSLPDISPKKVSATRNVYVSPLKSSKMDALISQNSKSYYACVGESTNAYQSPSKDLTAINNRLNSTRKVRGTLNFDDIDVGLVSDAMVANSLNLQNGSSDSPQVLESRALIITQGRSPFKVMAAGTSSGSPISTAEEKTSLLGTWLPDHSPAAFHPTKTARVIMKHGGKLFPNTPEFAEYQSDPCRNHSEADCRLTRYCNYGDKKV